MQSDNVNIVDNNAQTSRVSKIRSVSYPSYTLDSSLHFVGRINSEFTSLHFTPQEAISQTLGLSGGAFLQKLSTSVQYGLLQLKKGEGYKPTDLFAKINKPIPGENINDFYLECLQTPELYKRLFNDYKDKEVPSEAGLVNILDRLYSVKGAGAKLAAKIFLSNIRSANLINEKNQLVIGENYIPYEDVVEKGTGEAGEVMVLPDQQPKGNSYLEQQSRSDLQPPTVYEKKIPVFLKGGREAVVALPDDFTDDDLNRIVKVLSAYVS
ncbi:MAG: hypothetical protein KIT80_03035 [Chitinophagaceae bacterium]|nr:hypothetical protein [Chitinophagaceae bacterium]MCW5925860.1 hypothetical protein [Chitinophagaceae bacterium]